MATTTGLSALPVHQGVRMRGQETTRLDTFVDAAFAFSVTLLVVAFGQMPDSFAELDDALRRLPAFLAGFAIIATYWRAHVRYSRRFGLEDGWSLLLALTLVAATLFYVYPLRMVMSAGMHYFTGGWAPSEFAVRSFTEFRTIFVIYGIGFATLSGIIALLNLHALRKSAVLQLDAAERMVVRGEVEAQSLLAGCALLSIAIALLIPARLGWPQALPGLTYALLGVVMPVHHIWRERRVAALVAAREA